jgi:hypothetical protein
MQDKTILILNKDYKMEITNSHDSYFKRQTSIDYFYNFFIVDDAFRM